MKLLLFCKGYCSQEVKAKNVWKKSNVFIAIPFWKRVWIPPFGSPDFLLPGPGSASIADFFLPGPGSAPITDFVLQGPGSAPITVFFLPGTGSAPVTDFISSRTRRRTRTGDMINTPPWGRSWMSLTL